MGPAVAICRQSPVHGKVPHCMYNTFTHSGCTTSHSNYNYLQLLSQFFICNGLQHCDQIRFFFLYQLWRRSLGHPQIRYCFLEGECHLGRLTFRTKQTSDFLKVLAEIRSTEILIKMTRGFAECDKLLRFCTFTCCDILIRKLQRKKQICRAICTEREGQYEPYIQ